MYIEWPYNSSHLTSSHCHHVGIVDGKEVQTNKTEYIPITRCYENLFPTDSENLQEISHAIRKLLISIKKYKTKYTHNILCIK